MFPDLRRLRHLLAQASILLPSACALCGANGNDALCTDCRIQFFGMRRRCCRQCALPLLNGNESACGACMRYPPAFDATIAAVDYAPPLDQLVLTLKFSGRLALAPSLAQVLREAVRETLPDAARLPTVLAAVPLSRQRLAERGFNQAHEIAKPLARALRIPLAKKLVCRQRDTRPQSLLHPSERHDNIRDAFAVTDDAFGRIRGAHVGIVDDVMTTGHTLDALAATLKRSGAARVTNIVFARTLQNRI